MKHNILKAALMAALLVGCAGSGRAQVRLTEAEAKQAAVVKPLPEYPAMARQLHITGRVELEVVIETDGSVAEVKVVTGNPILTKPCAKTISAWKFAPVRRDGKAERVTAPLTFDFK